MKRAGAAPQAGSPVLHVPPGHAAQTRHRSSVSVRCLGGLQEPPRGGVEGLEVRGWPSKAEALVLGERGGEAALIFRSDSNGEDLEGCACAPRCSGLRCARLGTGQMDAGRQHLPSLTAHQGRLQGLCA